MRDKNGQFRNQKNHQLVTDDLFYKALRSEEISMRIDQTYENGIIPCVRRVMIDLSDMNLTEHEARKALREHSWRWYK